MTLNFYFSVILEKSIDINWTFFWKKEVHFIIYKILEIHYMFNTSKKSPYPQV